MNSFDSNIDSRNIQKIKAKKSLGQNFLKSEKAFILFIKNNFRSISARFIAF